MNKTRQKRARVGIEEMKAKIPENRENHQSRESHVHFRDESNVNMIWTNVVTFENFLFTVSTFEGDIPGEIVMEVTIPNYLMPNIDKGKTLNEQDEQWGQYKLLAVETITIHFLSRIVNVLKVRRDVWLNKKGSNWKKSRYYSQYKCELGCCCLNAVFVPTKWQVTVSIKWQSHLQREHEAPQTERPAEKDKKAILLKPAEHMRPNLKQSLNDFFGGS